MAMTDEQIERYSRHIILKEVGAKGQKKLLKGKVLIIGAGGLGDFAIRYGYQMGYRDMIWLTVIIILAVITIVQCFGQWIIRKTSH